MLALALALATTAAAACTAYDDGSITLTSASGFAHLPSASADDDLCVSLAEAASDDTVLPPGVAGVRSPIFSIDSSEGAAALDEIASGFTVDLVATGFEDSADLLVFYKSGAATWTALESRVGDKVINDETVTVVTAHVPALAECAVMETSLFPTFLRVQTWDTLSAADGVAGAEIVVWNKDEEMLVLSSGGRQVYVIDASDMANLEIVETIEVPETHVVTSVASSKKMFAIAATTLYTDSDAAFAPEDKGTIFVYNWDFELEAEYVAGYLPDMVTFSDDAKWLLAANEGEANDASDPPGSITVINMDTDAEFELFFDDVEIPGGINDVFPDGESTLASLEPEYIVVDPDNAFAIVTLQENNAIATIDLSGDEPSITKVTALGFKDHSAAGSGLDGSDEDGAINVATYANLKGMYQPDGMAMFVQDGTTYLLTANEGDAVSDIRIEDIEENGQLDASLAGLAAEIGRLQVSQYLGADAEGMFTELYSYGGRSFSVWNAESGELVWDSGDQMAQFAAQVAPELFNSEGTAATFDGRSDNKGVEPEFVAVGKINNVEYAFVAAERLSGIYMFDLTDITAPVLVQVLLGGPDNIAPESLVFINNEDSPSLEPVLIVAYEESGTLVAYNIQDRVTEIFTMDSEDIIGLILGIGSVVLLFSIASAFVPNLSKTVSG